MLGSVLPAPDSPLTTMHCEQPRVRSCQYAASETAKTCGSAARLCLFGKRAMSTSEYDASASYGLSAISSRRPVKV